MAKEPKAETKTETKTEEAEYEQFRKFIQWSGKVLRKIQNSLRKATSFWNEIHGLIITWGVDEETITSNVRTMNQDMIEDLIRNRRGTKRIRELAASLGITPRNLRIVAEVCNPSCFKQAVEKHGLERF